MPNTCHRWYILEKKGTSRPDYNLLLRNKSSTWHEDQEASKIGAYLILKALLLMLLCLCVN